MLDKTFILQKKKWGFYGLNHCPELGDVQDVAPHFKYLSLFIDVINFLLHHLMRHVLLQICTKKIPVALRSLKEAVRPVWSSFLALGSPQNCPVSLWNQVSSGLCSSRSFHQHHAIPPLSFPTRPPTRAVVGGACKQRIMWRRDGWLEAAVSSNCKILVILDSGLWLMGLIWRLNSFGPPLNTGGREEGSRITARRDWGTEDDVQM